MHDVVEDDYIVYLQSIEIPNLFLPKTMIDYDVWWGIQLSINLRQ